MIHYVQETSGGFNVRTGRPSIPPEKLLRALLLQALYTIRSERQLMEQLDFNLLFRWFVGLGIDDKVWDASTFAKNRERLLAADVSAKFLDVWRFKETLRDREVTPHMARRRDVGWGGVTIPDPPCYRDSQRHRKRIEEIFGWAKVQDGQAKTKFRGRQRVEAAFTLAVAACNLMRLPKLLPELREAGP